MQEGSSVDMLLDLHNGKIVRHHIQKEFMREVAEKKKNLKFICADRDSNPSLGVGNA